MNNGFQMEFTKDNDGLHVNAFGDFDDASAWRLTNLLHEHYTGKEDIFIDTHGIRDINPVGKVMLQCRLELGCIPVDCLFFKGKKGFRLAPEGSEVIVDSKETHCRCNGDCTNCRCSDKSDTHKSKAKSADKGWIYI